MFPTAEPPGFGERLNVHNGWNVGTGSDSILSMEPRMPRLLLFAAFIVASCARQDSQPQVSQSFERYMTAWERNDRKAVWNLMSERMQRGIGNDEAEIENDRETPDVRVLGHTTKSIRVSGDHATIEAEVRFSADWGRKQGH